MKTDEDIYASLHNIYHLADNDEFLLRTAIGGECYATAQPIRNVQSKYYTSIHLYPQRHYPGFCSGTGYISSMDVAKKIRKASIDIPFFHLEDVYIALVIRRLGYHLHEFHGFMSHYTTCNSPFKSKSLMTIHNVSSGKMYKLWKMKCGL